MVDSSSSSGVHPAASPSRRILHCDMDCFYAAVHMRDDPSLAGKPVVIGGDPAGRGVVAAASYEAREYGVRSAMPAARAVRLCPGAIFLKPDFPRYREESGAILEIYRAFTPLIQPVSIDEAYLDVTDRLAPHGTAHRVAKAIRRRVREERRLTVSVGVGPNKLIAKMASDFDKPDGLTVVPPGRVEAFLEPLPLRALRSVGPATERRLRELGCRTVGDVARLGLERLVERFGRHGRTLWEFSRGIDSRPVTTTRERKSLGSETTYRRDLTETAAMEAEIDRLAADVAQGLERHDLAGRTVTLKVRYDDFTTVTRSRTLPAPAASAESLAAHARDLLSRTEAAERPVRLLGVTASGLQPAEWGQLALFEP